MLRPAPGADRTIAALAATGLVATALPLFAVRPVAWAVPAGGYDAVVLTSANAVRHAGPGLAALDLPVLAVGQATAAAAAEAGLAVAATGEGDVAALLDAYGQRYPRLLHLAGRDRSADPRLIAVTVYVADPLGVTAAALAVLDGGVVLAHSPRAACRLRAVMAAHALGCADMRLAALSVAVATAAGTGWGAVAVADRPTDAAIVAAARRLAD
ncbi:uroporphyrinogen-III synthase [uncultured Sphingomonas sp.]|uniref:uroporphyrinogen-III synthase n=1 Tax=uncultured Sphingomonas sp. TaxID=158754 RepID=UPI0035CADA27